MKSFNHLLFYRLGMSYILIICHLQSQSQIPSQPVDNAINHSVHYLQSRIDSAALYFYIVPLLDPLNQYYQLGISPSEQYIHQYSTSEQELIRIFAPLTRYSQSIMPFIPSDLHSTAINRVLLFSLYGQQSGKSKHFQLDLDSLIQWGGYDLTHAYFSLLILQNTRFLPAKKIAKQLQKVKSIMLTLLPLPHQAYSDLDVEVIAMLLYGGEQLADDYILGLIHQQSDEGAFYEYSSDGKIDELMTDHKTVLALWALLEWKHINDNTLFLAK